MRGLRSTNGQSHNGHRDAEHSTGNIVNNGVITTYGARWVLEVSGATL